jgi:hypothetical protein
MDTPPSPPPDHVAKIEALEAEVARLKALREQDLHTKVITHNEELRAMRAHCEQLLDLAVKLSAPGNPYVDREQRDMADRVMRAALHEQWERIKPSLSDGALHVLVNFRPGRIEAAQQHQHLHELFEFGLMECLDILQQCPQLTPLGLRAQSVSRYGIAMNADVPLEAVQRLRAT